MTSPLDSIVVALKRGAIIPDVIPFDFVPTLLFSIVFPTGCEVATGNTLLREDTLDEPDIVITPMNLPFANADSTGEGDDFAKEVSYTLAMTDPDAPSAEDPKYRQSRHWLVRITHFVELSVQSQDSLVKSDSWYQVRTSGLDERNRRSGFPEDEGGHNAL